MEEAVAEARQWEDKRGRPLGPRPRAKRVTGAAGKPSKERR